MRSECLVAITLVVCRVSWQKACVQPCLQAGYCLSAVIVHLTLSTLFISHCTLNQGYLGMLAQIEINQVDEIIKLKDSC
jgi:hypothetical protein